MRLIFFLLIPLLNGCLTFFNESSLSDIEDDLQKNNALKGYYLDRKNIFLSEFHRSVFGGNVLEKYNSSTLFFADQTVYLGNFLGWQAVSLFDDADAAKRALDGVNFLIETLSKKTILSDGSENFGYFDRDSITQATITINGKDWLTHSDAQSGTNNDMSQDQLIHVIFNYYVMMKAITKIPNPNTTLTNLKSRIKYHADQIGLRLKDQNYEIKTPQGDTVKRGADARALAWPIAKTLSNITGNPIETYLNSLDLKGRLGVSNTELKEIFKAAIDAITTGLCNIKVGSDQKELCKRFTIALINRLYVSSQFYQDKPLYITRMNDDGAFLSALFAKVFRGDEDFPDKYLETLEDGIGGSLTDQSDKGFWCKDNRWIRLPTTKCPASTGGDPQHYNGLDYLYFYQALQSAPKLR